MNRFIAVSLLLAAIACAGCKTGPDYVRPDAKVPEGWSSPRKGGETDAPAIVTEWWKTLNDPVLDTLIAHAVEANLDLRMATSRVREARAARGIASSALKPSVGASQSYARTQTTQLTTLPGTDRQSDLFQIGFDAGWELDIFGGNRRAVEAANADLEATQESRRGVLLSLLSEVALNYIELRAGQNRLDIANRNIDAQAKSETLTRDRFRVGLNSELDAVRAHALLTSTQSQIPPIETQIAKSIHRLGVLLGKDPGTLKPELDASAPLPAPPDSVPVGLPSDLLRRRPDIRQSERELAAATARIGQATADLFPKFSLTGNFGGQSETLGSILSGANQLWSIGPGVRWPIFQGGRVRANIEVHNARQEQAAIAYEKSILVALEDVENGLESFASEQTRREALRATVESNEKAVRLANERYLRGLEGFLNVLQAQQSLFNSEDQLVQSQSQVLVNLVALYKALGGGWEVQEK